MRIALVGLPGSGKTTQSHNIENFYDIDRIATSNLIRQSYDTIVDSNGYFTDDGEETLKTYVSKGQKLPQDTISHLIEDEIIEREKYILDGYPRDMAQSEHLNSIGGINTLIVLETCISEVKERLKERGRHGDEQDSIEERIHWQKKGLEEVINYYRDTETSIQAVDGNQSKEDVWQDIRSILSK